MTLDGKIYAVPFHTSWRGLFYPIDEMQKLGYDKPPQNWDELMAFGEKAKAAKPVKAAAAAVVAPRRASARAS